MELLQGDMAGKNGGGEENGSRVGEFLCRLGGEVVARAARSKHIADGGMAVQVVAERKGDKVALGDALRRGIVQPQPVVNLRFEQRIVGATEDDGINLRVLRKQSGQVLVHEIIRSLVEVFARFDEGYPHRARLLGNA